MIVIGSLIQQTLPKFLEVELLNLQKNNQANKQKMNVWFVAKLHLKTSENQRRWKKIKQEFKIILDANVPGLPEFW